MFGGFFLNQDLTPKKVHTTFILVLSQPLFFLTFYSGPSHRAARGLSHLVEGMAIPEVEQAVRGVMAEVAEPSPAPPGGGQGGFRFERITDRYGCWLAFTWMCACLRIFDFFPNQINGSIFYNLELCIIDCIRKNTDPAMPFGPRNPLPPAGMVVPCHRRHPVKFSQILGHQ